MTTLFTTRIMNIIRTAVLVLSLMAAALLHAQSPNVPVTLPAKPVTLPDTTRQRPVVIATPSEAVTLPDTSRLRPVVDGTENHPVTLPDTTHRRPVVVDTPPVGMRYALSPDDFAAGVWHDLGSYLETSERTSASQLWTGGGDLELTTGNKAYDKALKKEVFIVQDDTVLYVNLRRLRCEKMAFGNNYTRAWVMPDRTLVFSFYPIGRKVRQQMAVGSAFGIVGSAVNAGLRSRQMKHRLLYVLRPGATEAIRADRDVVTALLNEHPDEQRQFASQCADGSYEAENAIHYLLLAGVIR